MGSIRQLLSLAPLTPEEIGYDPYENPRIKTDVLQLATDAINVLEGRILLSSFDQVYQLKIRNFYRFCATRSSPKEDRIAKRITETLDIV